MRFVPIVGFLILVLLLVLLLVARPAAQLGTENAQKPLPTLALTALEGSGVWQQEHLRGRVTVLNFFASWCTPCAAEMPELAALKKKFPALQLEGVAWNDDAKTLKPWLKKNHNPFGEVWVDKGGEATIALGIRGIPETMIVDGAGVVRYRLAGPLTPALRETVIDPLIATLLVEAADAR